MADINLGAELKISAVGAQTAWDAFVAGGQAAGKATNASLGGTVRKDVVARIIVDDKGLNKVVFLEKERLSVVDKLNAALQKANSLETGSLTSLRQQVNQAKQLRDSIAKYGVSVNGVFGKVGKLNGAWEVQNAKVKDLKRQLDIAGASNIWERLAAEYNLGGLAQTGRQISELVNVFQSVSIIVGQVIGSVNQLFDALQRLQSIKLTFEGIGRGGDVDKVFSESTRIASGLGVSLNTVRDGFQQLSPVILATGGNIGDVSAITESLSSRFVTFGLSADKSRRVMNGVVQAFSKGKLMAEELTQQISEADPAFRTDLAEAIGVTVKELGDMVQAGQVTNAVLLEAIPRMTKASELFGKLGDSALDAAQGFREGGVTVEQFRNKIATIEQLSLENLVNPETGSLGPLLASLLELRAVVTDVGVAFASSEVFKTFIVLLGAIASQVSFVVQVLVSLGSAIASITQPVFGTINAIDSLGGLLQGFGIISSLVAGIIVTKLVASLVTLGSGAIVGAATAAITGLTKAIVFFSSGAAAGLVNSIAASIVQFTGLTTAAAGSAGAQAAATAATTARAGAGAFLLKALGLQAAAEALSASAAGTAAAAQVKTAGGIVITGAAAAATTAPVTGLTTATAGLAAAAGAVVIPFLAIAAALAVLGVGFLAYNAATKDGAALSSSFSLALDGIKSGAEAAKKALDEGGNSADEFTNKLKALELEKEKADQNPYDFSIGGLLELKAITGALDFIADRSFKGVASAATEATGIVLEGTTKVIEAVKAYDKVNDQSGAKAKKLAIDLVAAQGGVTAALDLTRAKRKQLLEEEAKSPEPTSKDKLEALTILDQQIKALEEVERIQASIRAEARKEGIVIDVELDIQDAAAITGDLREELKGLKASIVLETNPGKKAELQGDLNGLQAQLEFLEADPVQVTIDADFKINQRALQDAASLSDAIINNLAAATTYAQSLFGLQAAYLSGAEKTKQTELDSINERLDKEKEIRQEAIESAKERGASEATIKALEKEGRAAERVGREEIKAKEKEIEAIAENKRRIETEALKAKLSALPAQQQAERASLVIQQQLTQLELERLRAAAERARLEGQQRLIKLGGEISEARANNDPAAEQRAIDLYNNQLKLNGLLDAETRTLDTSIAKRAEINGLQQTALGYKQAAETLDVQSALASVNGLNTQQQTTTAVKGTSTAMATVATNAAAYAQAAKIGSEYEKSGGAAARIKADAELDAAKAADEAGGSAQDYAQAMRDAAGTTNEAAGTAGDITNDLQDSVTAADGITSALTGLDGGVSAADGISSSLATGVTAAQGIANAITALDGKSININVNYVGQPGLWTGGPTVGGQTYRINELGKEGFLSSTGDLSPINKPRNALWKAPGKGMVIPAHIMSTLDVPTGRVSTGVRPAVTGSSGNGLAKIARAIHAALSQTNKPDSGLQEMAAVQAHQSIQIGKLSRAVTKLADKDWNVNVGVRNTGSTAYLDALNRRM